MSPLSETIKQAHEALDDLLRMIRAEQECLNPALSEADRSRFVEQESRYEELYCVIAKHDICNGDLFTDSESVSKIQKSQNQILQAGFEACLGSLHRSRWSASKKPSGSASVSK